MQPEKTLTIPPDVVQYSALEKITPKSLEAEQSTLGAMMTSRDAISKVIELKLTAADFYREANARIYQCIVDLFNQGYQRRHYSRS